MADISAIFFILLILGIAFPAMLAAWWLLFPTLIARAQTRVEKTPWQTFWMGLILVFAVSIPIVILLVLPFGPAQFIGWMLIVAGLAVSSIGAAGIAAHLGTRLSQQGKFTPLGAFIRGAILLELAAFLPIIGWLFVWIPMLTVSFGATGFALLNWVPREKAQPAVTPLPEQA
jgi:hypothetical protein